jgi:hypothetical protein
MLDVKYKVYCFAGDIARANGGQCNGCLVATREGTTGFLFANAGNPTGTQLDTVGQQYSWVCFVVIGYVYFRVCISLFWYTYIMGYVFLSYK